MLQKKESPWKARLPDFLVPIDPPRPKQDERRLQDTKMSEKITNIPKRAQILWRSCPPKVFFWQKVINQTSQTKPDQPKEPNKSDEAAQPDLANQLNLHYAKCRTPIRHEFSYHAHNNATPTHHLTRLASNQT